MPTAMSTAPKTNSAPAAEVGGAPSSGVRSLISFLLFVHFFFLLVSVKSQTDSSGLEQDIAQKVPGLRQYTQLLGMNLSYMFNFTYYLRPQDPDDASQIDYYSSDVILEIQLPGATDYVPVATPGWPATRARRMERVVKFAVPGDSDQEDDASVALQAIATRLMAEHNVQALRLRMRTRLLQEWLDYTSDMSGYKEETAKSARDPEYLRTIYEADAILGADGRAEIVPVKPASQMAPPYAAPQPAAQEASR